MPTQARSLTTLKERAKSGVEQFRRMLPEDRLREFARQGFYPHGYFLPDDPALREKVHGALKRIGAVAQDVDERLRRYYALQAVGAEMERRGVPGHWTGQHGVARSEATFRLVEWGRRSGKTKYAANEIVAVLRSRPRSTAWCAAKTYDLAGRCFDQVEQLLIDLGEAFIVHRNTQQTKLIVLKNGSRVEGISLENYQGAAGAAVDFVVVDEAAQIEGDAWYRAILPPLADRQGQALLISSHEGEETFFYKKAQEARGDGAWQVFQDATWDVNFYMFPQGRESPALLQMEREMDPVDFLEQFGAIPARARNLVFPEFREKVHVGDYPFNPKHPVVLAIDPSGGANPYAVVVIQDYEDYCVVIDEFYRGSVTAEDVSGALQSRPWRQNVVDVVVDSAIPTEVQRWARMHWPARPVVEKPEIQERLPLYRNLLRDPRRYARLYRGEVNAILATRGRAPDSDLDDSPEAQRTLALEVVRRLADDKALAPGQLAALRDCARIFFNSTCYWSIQEHLRYKFMKVGAASQSRNPREKPADSWNHVLDCLVGGTLIDTIDGPTPIEDVREGDYVTTREGTCRRVLRVWEKHPASEVVRVSFSDGRVLAGTPDHLLYVRGRDWTALKDLQSGDEPITISQCEVSLSSTTGSYTTDIRTRRSDIDESISTRATSSSIARSGGSTTAPSPRTTTSTTSTETPSTTTPQTWSASPRASTYRSTSPPGSPPAGRASNAVARMSPSPGGRTSNTARGTATRMRAACRALTTKIASAWGAGRHSGSGSISDRDIVPASALRVVRLETLTGRFPVYDLTVEGSHEFFANGLLTHNCLGYFTWMYHRFDQAKAPLGSKSILKPVGTADAPPEVELPRAVTTPDRMNLFVRELRARYAPAASRTKTILRAAG